MDAGGKEYIFLTVFLEEEEEERRGGAHERTRRGALHGCICDHKRPGWHPTTRFRLSPCLCIDYKAIGWYGGMTPADFAPRASPALTYLGRRSTARQGFR